MKFKFLTLAVVFISMSMLGFSQTPGSILWTQPAWEPGATDLASYTCSGGQYLIVAKSLKGTVQIHKYQKAQTQTKGKGNVNSSMKKVSEKTGLKTGTWSISTFKKGTKNFLFISYANYGQANIYVLNNNGTIGAEVWRTEVWEKGISESAILKVNGKISLVIMRPSLGWAWNFDILNDGKIGNALWATNTWEKGMTGMSSYDEYLVLTKPNGKAWIIKANSAGNLDNITWSTNTWVQGITNVEASFVPGVASCMYLTNPLTGQAFAFRGDDAGQAPKFMWNTTAWNKGIDLMNVFQGSQGNFLFLTHSSTGQAYLLEIN